MRTQKLSKAVTLSLTILCLVYRINAQNTITDFNDSQLIPKIETNDIKTPLIVKDSIPDQRNEKGTISSNLLNLELINGSTRKGYIGNLMSDSIKLINKFGSHHTTSIYDIININVEKKKNNSPLGTILGIAIGTLPGFLLLHEAKTRDKNLLDAIVLPGEILLGTTVLIGGAIAGGLIGRNIGRGITVAYPINASKDLYQRQKERIMNDAFRQ